MIAKKKKALEARDAKEAELKEKEVRVRERPPGERGETPPYRQVGGRCPGCVKG